MDERKGVSIKDGSHLSINDLVGLKNEGAFVIRTGHLGNHYFSNLLLFSCGIPCHLFDRNLSVKDRNFWPGSIIAGEERMKLAGQENVLVPFSRFSSRLNGASQFIGSAKNPAQVHLRSLIKIYGENVWTESQFLHKNIHLVRKIAGILAATSPDLFIREIDKEGFTNLVGPGRRKNDVVEEFLRANKLMCLAAEGKLDDFPGGLIPKIEVTILINSILGFFDSGRSDLYELSGPDMIKYAMKKGFQRSLNRLYMHLQRFMPELPERMTLHIVPTFFFRFGSLGSERRNLNSLLEKTKEFSVINSEKRSKLKKIKSTISTRRERVKIQGRLQDVGSEYNRTLNILAGDIHSNPLTKRMLFSLESGTFFSQYDLLKSGECLHVPEEVKSMSMKEIENLFKVMMIAMQRAVE